MKKSELRKKMTAATEVERQQLGKSASRRRNGEVNALTSTAAEEEIEQPPDGSISRELPTHEQSNLVLKRLGNEPSPGFVLYGGVPHRIVRRDEYTIREKYSREALLSYLARVASFVRLDRNKQWLPTDPPRRLAEDLLHLPEFPESIPTVQWLKNVPILTPDGAIIATSGLYPEQKTYLELDPSLNDFQIPKRIRAQDLKSAVDTILDPLHDFPVAETSTANLVALLSTLVFRDLIGGVTPLFCIDANQPGTGKGLLCSVLSMIAYGREAEFSPGNVRSDEVRKRLFALAAQGVPMHVLDNVEQTVWSPELAAWLTASSYTDRRLGKSAIYTYRNSLVVIATGNNLRIGGDIARRTVLIQLESTHARPEERDGFRYPEVLNHVHEHRREILQALYTIAAQWLRQGRPLPEDTPQMGSFQEWVNFCTGMLYTVDGTGLLDNRDLLRGRDQDAEDYELMLARGLKAFGNEVFTAKDLVSVLGPDEFPPSLGGARHGSLTKSMGRLLTRIENRAFGRDELTVHFFGTVDHTKKYRIDAKKKSEPVEEQKGE